MDCTEEEAYTFAALQFQVKLAQAQTPATNVPVAKTTVDESVTDIDAALNNLQVLIGSGLLYLHCTYMYNGVCVCTCMHAYTVYNYSKSLFSIWHKNKHSVFVLFGYNYTCRLISWLFFLMFIALGVCLLS